MAKAKLMVTYWNTTNLPQGVELERLKNNCNSDAEKVLLLYQLYPHMTVWEAHRKFEEHFETRQKVAIGARIKGLCEVFNLYRSTEKRRDLETNSLNYVFKLFPQNGDMPDDYDMSTLESLHTPLQFDTQTGIVDGMATLNQFIKKLNKKLAEYDAQPINLNQIN